MLDQIRTGKFIASIRKEKGMTQKQLADSIGVSDKAISRWETGRGMPDTSIMPELCNVLDVNINELLSGERLSVEAYNRKAEDNMVELMKDTEKIKRDFKSGIIGTLIGICLLIVLIFLFINLSGGFYAIAWFIDFPSLLAVICIMLAVLGASGQFTRFFQSFKIAFNAKSYPEEELPELVKESEYALDLGIRATMYGGIISSLIGVVILFGHLSEPSTIGPNLAVAILTWFYAGLLSLIALIIKGRIHRFIQ